jgi:hypothetical protein
MQVITMLKQDTVCPNFSQKKTVLQNCLTQHNIPFSATDAKKVDAMIFQSRHQLIFKPFKKDNTIHLLVMVTIL